MSSNDVLLIIIHFTPPQQWVDTITRAYPALRIEIHKTDMYTKTLPDISRETWKSTTVLFTWKLLPTKEMAPNLQYVQLLSAGCSQITGLPIFEDTDIAFCTSNGVHPWVY